METRPLKKRLGEAVAVMLMGAFFGFMTLVFLAIMPLLVLRYIVTGTEAARDDVKSPGKALDQLVNAAFFRGHPKETLSSHAGRWIFVRPNDAPWWAHVVEKVTGVFEHDHVLKAIEAPFLNEPLDRR